MRLLFEELIKGNLPKKEEFNLVKGENYFYLCRVNPIEEQIMAFNLDDANSEIVEERWKEMFRWFGYRLNEGTKEWEHFNKKTKKWEY